MCPRGSRSQVMRNVGFGISLAQAILCLALATGAHAAADKRPPSFAEVVHRNFAKWDRDHDGVLSAAEVDRVVKSHSVKGSEAAAIAAIHHYLRGDNAPNEVSESDLLPESTSTAKRRDVHDGRPHFNVDYAAYCRHLKSAPRALFKNPAGPALIGMSQGNLGDCYFVSTVGVAVLRDRDAVRDLFHPRPDGSIDVRFPGGNTVHVAPLTDAEIALTSTAGRQGLWLNVLEKALSSVMVKLPKAKTHPGDIELDTISRGGKPAITITLMTGHATTTTMISQKDGKTWRRPTNAELPVMNKRLHRVIARACGQGGLICAITPRKGKLPAGIANHHVYAVLSYDEPRQIVCLWNPWGNNFEPKTKQAGLKNGYPIRHGRLDMPLDDFLRVFDCVVAESPEKPQRI